MAETADAFSAFEPWLHRAVLRAGLGLADQSEGSRPVEEEIVEQLVYLYLTSPYESFRQACAPVLQAWKGTAVAERAVRLDLSLLDELEALRDSMDSADAASPVATRSLLQERFRLYYRHLTHESQSSLRLLRLQLILVLHQLGDRTTASDFRQYLVAALSDPSSTARQVAATTLGQVGLDQPEIIDGLLRTLTDAVPEVRRAAVEALGQIGTAQPKVITALLHLLNGSDSQMGSLAAAALGQVGKDQPEVLDALLRILSDLTSDHWVRAVAARALGELGGAQPEVLEALVHVLSGSLTTDPWGKIHQEAARALGRLGSVQPEVLDTLVRISNANFYPHDYPVRWSAAEALAQLSKTHPEILDGLLQSLATSASHVRHTVAGALEEVGLINAAVYLALTAAGWQGRPVREAAGSGLEEGGDVQPEVIDALLHTLADSAADLAVHQAAAAALGQVGMIQPEVLDGLLHALRASDWRVSEAAAWALGQLGAAQPQVLDGLLAALSNPFARYEAVATALLQLSRTRPEILDRLLQLLSDHALRGRGAITEALGNWGDAQPKVLGALLYPLTDPYLGLRESAVKALGQLGKDHPPVAVFLRTLLSDASATQELPTKHVDQQQQAIERGLMVRLISFFREIGATQPEALNVLLHALTDADPGVRQAAVGALGEVDLAQLATNNTLSDADWFAALLQHTLSADWRVSPILGRLGMVQPTILTALLDTLSDTEKSKREVAIIALSEVHTAQPEILEALLQIVNGPDKDLRSAAIQAVGRLGVTQPGVLEALLHALNGPDRFVQYAAANALGQLGAAHPEALHALLHALDNTSTETRLTIIWTLTELGIAHPTVLEGLQHAFSSEVIAALLKTAITASNPWRTTQRAATEALKQLKPTPPKVLAFFLHTLTSSTEYFEREAAAIALGELGVAQPEILSALTSALDDPSYVGRAAAKALGQLGRVQPELLETLLHMLRTTDGNVRTGLALALGVLFDALDDAAIDVREAIVTRLRSLIGAQPELLDTLLNALREPNGVLRRAVARALGALGTVQADTLEALLAALSDAVSGVREAAAKSLGVLAVAKKEVLDALTNVLSDADGTVRVAAATALGELGAAQPQVLDALLAALTDPVREVRQAVTHTLTRLPVDRLATGRRLLEKLSSYEAITSNQFTADPVVDELFAALQQIVEAV